MAAIAEAADTAAAANRAAAPAASPAAAAPAQQQPAPAPAVAGEGFVDVHAHLIHPKFEGVEDEIALKCAAHGLEWVVVNGLEPHSNRRVLEFCERHANLAPAL